MSDPFNDPTPVEYELMVAEEALVLDATELLHRLLAESGLTKVELAGRLGVTKARVSHILSASNLTLRTLARVAWALDLELTVRVKGDR